jgi:hypothetical protein
MRIFVCVLALGALALGATGCGGTTDGSDGDVTNQVFGTWSCTATSRPSWSFTVTSLGPETTKHSWTDNVAGGGAHTAYVHLSELYLDDANDEPFRNFLYTTDAAMDTLTALDEFPDFDGVGVPSYHCVK